MINSILNRIAETRIIAIIRGTAPDLLEPTLEALLKGGIQCVEITMDTPDALKMIEFTKVHYGSRLMVGAGTVLDAVTARLAIIAGADFVLSPTLSIEMIQMCNTYGKLAVPGVFTPTEALTAYQAGAQLIKVFPVGTVGPDYIKDIKGPLKQLNLIPVGGVSLENAAAFKKAGAFALGIGSCLVNNKLQNDGNFEEITNTAQQFIKIMQ